MKVPHNKRGSLSSHLPVLPALVFILFLLLPAAGAAARVDGFAAKSLMTLDDACPAVTKTPYINMVYGYVPTGAAVGSVVKAYNPRGDLVGCSVVGHADQYGLMHVYGEDPSTTPILPGMRPGEQVIFHLNDLSTLANPALTWADSWSGEAGAWDWQNHAIDLAPISQGDCNSDTKLDAGDISALVLEIFDSDGAVPNRSFMGTFQGSTGCDANVDGVVDAGDISCTVLMIFGGSCS